MDDVRFHVFAPGSGLAANHPSETFIQTLGCGRADPYAEWLLPETFCWKSGRASTDRAVSNILIVVVSAD